MYFRRDQIETTTMDSASLKNVRAAKLQALEVFSKIADVVGVGITSVGSEYALKINIKSLPEKGVDLPTHVDGVPVKIEVVGTIRKSPRGTK